MNPRSKLLSGAEVDRQNYSLYITPLDIANVLAFTPVWPESTSLFYSHAEMALLRMQYAEGSYRAKLGSLLFDSPITYLGTGHYGNLPGKSYKQTQREVDCEQGLIRVKIYERFGLDELAILAGSKHEKEVEDYLMLNLLGRPTIAPLDCYAARKEWQRMFDTFYPGAVNDRVKFIRTRIDDYPYPFAWGDGMCYIVRVKEDTFVVDFDSGDSGVEVDKADISFFYPHGRLRRSAKPYRYG